MGSAADRERIEAIRKRQQNAAQWHDRIRSIEDSDNIQFLLAQLSALTEALTAAQREVESLMAAVCTDDDVPDATPVCHLARAHRQDSAIVDSEIEKRERAEEALTACQQERDGFAAELASEIKEMRGVCDERDKAEAALTACRARQGAVHQTEQNPEDAGVNSTKPQCFTSGNDVHEHDARAYLGRLLTHYAPRCEPLSDLMGLCSQIDNLLTACRAQGEALRRVPTEFVDGNQRHNAQRAWLAGFAAALSSTPKEPANGS